MTIRFGRWVPVSTLLVCGWVPRHVANERAGDYRRVCRVARRLVNNGDAKADILLRDPLGNLGMWLMNGPTITGGAFAGSPGAYTAY